MANIPHGRIICYAPPQHLSDADFKAIHLALLDDMDDMDTWLGNANLSALLRKMMNAYPDEDEDSLADFCIRWAIFTQYDYGYDPIKEYEQEMEAREKMNKKDIANNTECGAEMIDEMNKKAEHFTADWYILRLPRVNFTEKVGFRVMRPYNNEGDLPLSGMFNSTMEIIENSAKEHHILDAVKIQDMPSDSVCGGSFGTLIVDVMYTKISGDKILQFMELRHDLSTRDWGPITALVSPVMYKQN